MFPCANGIPILGLSRVHGHGEQAARAPVDHGQHLLLLFCQFLHTTIGNDPADVEHIIVIKISRLDPNCPPDPATAQAQERYQR